jgi:hypothetical protein
MNRVRYLILFLLSSTLLFIGATRFPTGFVGDDGTTILGLLYGGLGVDASGYEGIVGISGGATYELNTAVELETAANLGDFFSDYADEDTAADFRTAVGLTIGTDVLAPTGDGSGLTNLPSGGTVGATLRTFGDGDATPDITNGGASIERLWQVHQSSTPTITDFDDGDDHSEFSDGDYFVLIVNYGARIDFSNNSNIEGNANTDFTGSASQIVVLKFTYEGTQWKEENLVVGMSTPTQMNTESIAAKFVVVSDADGINLTDSDCGKTILMTGAGTVGFPDCDADLIGCGVKVGTRDASEQVVFGMYGDQTNDLFVLMDGTALDANDEVDLPSGADTDNDWYEIACLETNKWYIVEEDGTCTDGDAPGASCATDSSHLDESGNTGNSVGLTTWGRGQRFRVTSAGDLSAIELTFDTDYTCTATMRVGTSEDLETSYHEEIASESVTTATHKFSLSTPMSVVTGTDYYFSIVEDSGACKWERSSTNDYANGEFRSADGADHDLSVSSGQDGAFEIFLCD